MGLGQQLSEQGHSVMRVCWREHKQGIFTLPDGVLELQEARLAQDESVLVMTGDTGLDQGVEQVSFDPRLVITGV
jgi:hypothetical protein